jgi:hypothetical protein
VPYLLRHGTSVYAVSSAGPAPTPHSGILTRDARIIRSLHSRSNHCPTRATLKWFGIRDNGDLKEQINRVQTTGYRSEHVNLIYYSSKTTISLNIFSKHRKTLSNSVFPSNKEVQEVYMYIDFKFKNS